MQAPGDAQGRCKHLCTEAASVSGETLRRHRGDASTCVLKLHLCQERCWGDTGDTQAPLYWSCICVRRDAGETLGSN